MDEQEIIGKVRKCVATALGREAEWIDYLDITFQLEKSFGITIQKDELFPQKIFQEEKYVKDGVVTEAGLDFLGEKLPYADLSQFKQDPKVTKVPDLFTVGLLVNYVKTKIG